MEIRNLFPRMRRRRGDVSGGDPVLALRTRVNQLFDDFVRDPWGSVTSAWSGRPLSLDVAETDTEVRVEVELPGVDEKDVHISLADDRLTIRGEKSAETEEQGEGYHRVEREFGSFQRTIPLPCEVDPEKATATFRRGVLVVRMPKMPGARPNVREIPIRSE